MSSSPDNAADPQPPIPRFGPPTTSNPLWRFVIVAGSLFCLSCLLWITASFANPEAPGNRWLNRNGLILVVVTGIAAMFSALAAMVTDAVQTRRLLDAQETTIADQEDSSAALVAANDMAGSPDHDEERSAS